MKFSCEKALLQSAIGTAARAVSPKSSIPALAGILLEAGNDLRLTGYNLETGIRTTVPAQIEQGGSLVLSARLFGEIIRKLPDDVVVFSADGYMVHISCGMSHFNILATDPEDFPELPSVEDKNGFTIKQSALGSMIRQTLFAVSDNESRPIHTGSLFEVDSTGVTVVSVDGYRLALRHESIEESGGLEIGFNNRYLMDALKAAPAEKVRLELTSGVAPCVILPAEGEENFLYMVLPVRLKVSE